MMRPLITIGIALLLGALMIIPTGVSPWTAYGALAAGAFGSWSAIATTLVRSTPLLFTGLAAALAFQAGIFNIGAEGQFYFGALAAALTAVYLPFLPGWLRLPLALLAAAVAGGLWSYPAAYLRSSLGVSEVLTTIMLNNIATLLTAYLATYPFKGDLDIGATYAVPAKAQLAPLGGAGALNVGFLLALAVAALTYVLLFRTAVGYEFRALGANDRFARYFGTPIGKRIFQGLFLSGAIAGLGGAEQVLGVHHRFISNFSPGYAFTGITVALLARLHPGWVVVTSIFFGALESGALRMEANTNVSRDLLTALQGIIILLLAAEALLNWRKRAVQRRKTA